MAIIRDMQFDPVSENLIHVDLQEVAMDRAIQVTVAVHHVGEADRRQGHPGHPRDGPPRGAGLLPARRTSRSTSRPTSRTLAIHDVLTVKDLKVPEGVRVLNDPNQAGRHRRPADGRGGGGGGRGDDGSGGGRARGAHRAQAQGGEAAEGDAKDKGREEEVGGPGHRRPGQSGPGVSQHPAQRGPARRRRAGPSHSRALRARQRSRGRLRPLARRAALPHQAGQLHERHRRRRWRGSPASSTWAPPT